MDPKLAVKEVKKRSSKRNDQLMNEPDPVLALLKSKKIKNNLDEAKLRVLFQSVKDTKLMEVF